MTRAHARLLGPCFKTGPESTQSYSVADGRSVGPSEDSAANSPRGLAAGRTRTSRGPAPFAYRRARRPGHRGSVRYGANRPNGLPCGPLAGTQRVATSYKGRSARVRHLRATGRAGWRERRPSRFGPRPAVETRLNLPVRPFGFLRFTPERFHVLLNSLFKVLFNFPSRYLFAIGLVVIFSLRWSLPPA
jgi:hypothetical protein